MTYSQDSLFQVLRDCGMGAIPDEWEDGSNAAFVAIDGRLDAFCAAFNDRFVAKDGVARPPHLTKRLVMDEYKRNPHKVQAFLQALLSGCSPEILVAVWRILRGAEISSLTLTYKNDSPFDRQSSAFKLEIALKSAETERELSEVYTSNDIVDVSVINHLGAMTIDGYPWLGDFYPLVVTDKESQ